MFSILTIAGRVIEYFETGSRAKWHEYQPSGTKATVTYNYDLMDQIRQAIFDKDMDDAIAYCLTHPL